MDDAKKILAESSSAEAVNAEANAAEARERARLAQLEAYRVETTKALSDALRDVFGEHESSGRFIDVSRIPLICRNIEGIASSLQDIKDSIEKNRVDHEAREKENDRRYVNQDQFTPIKDRIDGLTDNQKWVVRTIGALVIAAVMGVILMR